MILLNKIKFLKKNVNEFLIKKQEHNISEYAAQCAYYIVLSFIPFMILLLTLIQYLGIDKQNLFYIFKTIIPENLYETEFGIIQEVNSKSIVTISISLIFVIWSSGKGFYSLCKGLQEINEKKDKSTYIFLKIRSIICTIALSFLIILALILMVFGKTINSLIGDKFDFLNIILKVRDGIVVAGLFVFLILVYKFIPKNKNKLKYQIPGAIVASIGWLIISKIFSAYLTIFKGFSLMYGSLTTIMLIMMWVYFCIYIILIGAEINNIILKNKKSKK